MFVAHLFLATRGSELQWVWRARAGFIIVVRKRKTWRQITQPRESHECTQCGQHWNRICLLNESQMCFFCSSALCGIWLFGGPLLPSLNCLLSPSMVCMSNCVTQTGSPSVRVSVAQCVSCCQEDMLWMQPRIKGIIRDWEQHDSAGEVQNNHLVCCRTSETRVVYLFYLDLYSRAIYLLL